MPRKIGGTGNFYIDSQGDLTVCDSITSSPDPANDDVPRARVRSALQRAAAMNSEAAQVNGWGQCEIHLGHRSFIHESERREQKKGESQQIIYKLAGSCLIFPREVRRGSPHATSARRRRAVIFAGHLLRTSLVEAAAYLQGRLA